MILSDKEIRKLCVTESEEKMITPFSEESLQSESYDLTIGDAIFVLKKETGCIDLTNQQALDDMYEEIPLTSDGYVLSPQEYIFVPIKEKITLSENLTAHIRPRTRFTRLGLLVSDQHCNSTYSGNLKLGVYNATNFPIKILPNIKIAQIVFEELKSVPSLEKQYKNKLNAVYQQEKDFIGAKFSDEIRQKIEKAVNIVLGEENG